MAVVLPTLNLHWLPSIIANPNIGLNPSQLSSIASNLPSGIPTIAPAVGPSSSTISSPITLPSGPISPSLIFPGGNVLTSGGAIYTAPPGTIQMSGIPIPASTAGRFGVTPLPQSVAASSLIMPQQTSAHYESDIPGGSEKEKESIAAGAATLIPAIRVPTTESNITTGMGTIIAQNVETSKTEAEKEEDQFIKQIDEVISPKGIIFNITIHTVIISAFVFIAILTWFEVIRTWYDQTFDPTLGIRNVDLIFTRFWYAVFITSLVIILVYILYRWAKT